MADSANILRILVPCDYSQVSRQALEASAKFDWRMPVEIFVLSVEEPLQTGAQRANSGGDPADWIAAFPPTLKIQPLHVAGRFVDTMLDVIDAHHIDLIVIGTRGARGWDGVFMGSHAERIVRIAPVPVLAIQQRADLGRLSEIVVPIDIDHDPAELQACLSRVSKLLRGRFHLLYISANPDGERAAMKQLTAYADKLALAHFTTYVVNSEQVAEGILKYAVQIGADLIAMGTMGTPDPAHMFRPSITADVVNHARVPVLTCPLWHRQALIPHQTSLQ